MTPIDITAVERVIAAATPGPWRAEVDNGYPWVSGPYDDNIDGACTIVEWNETGSGACADAAFIAYARTALPEALDEIERLRALVDEACEIAARNIEALQYLPSIEHDRILAIRNAAKGTP